MHAPAHDAARQMESIAGFSPLASTPVPG